MGKLLIPLARGVDEAQHTLGLIFACGQGVPGDLVLAHLWFSLASAGDSSSDEDARRAAIQMRDSIKNEMTLEQIAEAQKLAREWKPR
jgi:TPR repeat protein